MNERPSDPSTPDPEGNRRMGGGLMGWNLGWLSDAWERRDEEAASIFAVLMAGIAMLFIAGIVTAFITARDNAEERAQQQNAERAAASAAATANPSGASAYRQIPPITQPETTGSGSAQPSTRPMVHPREDEQNENPR
ncbi:MAG: hypothetical protein K2Y27_01975 [Xanthobacteraceae bacterium]|nr:hypothetical protein [Xanthobacteraceae bacterium]